MIYKRKVNFYETDAQGVVHHSIYPRYFEEARGYYLEKIGYPYERIRDEMGIEIVLIELSVRYKNPLFFGDEFYIDFHISHMDRFIFSFDYLLKKNGKLLAKGKTVHTCLDRNTRKIVSIPGILRAG